MCVLSSVHEYVHAFAIMYVNIRAVWILLLMIQRSLHFRILSCIRFKHVWFQTQEQHTPSFGSQGRYLWSWRLSRDQIPEGQVDGSGSVDRREQSMAAASGAAQLFPTWCVLSSENVEFASLRSSISCTGLWRTGSIYSKFSRVIAEKNENELNSAGQISRQRGPAADNRGGC